MNRNGFNPSRHTGRKWLGTALAAVGLTCAGAASANLVLYGQPNMNGRSFVIDRQVNDLDVTRWNDRASSMVIESGAWEVCTDSHFRGTCRILGPGAYPTLGDLGDRISSARPVQRYRDRYSYDDWQRGWYDRDGRWHPGRDYWRDRDGDRYRG